MAKNLEDIFGHRKSSRRTTSLLHAFRPKTRSTPHRLECTRLLATDTVGARQCSATSALSRTTRRGHVLFEQSNCECLRRVDAQDMGGRHGTTCCHSKRK